MKKIIIILLSCILLLAWNCAALSAVHTIEKISLDTWYYIEPEPVLFQVYFNQYKITETPYALSAYYRLNDQTFASVRYADNDVTTSKTVTGSYLFDSGLFLGAGYSMIEAGSDSSFRASRFSPGYRFNFKEAHSYLAFSVDYGTVDSTYTETDFYINGYDLDLAYYTDKLKILGEVYASESEYTSIELEGAYKATDRLVAGGNLSWDGADGEADLGFTYTADRYIFDAEISKEFTEEFCAATGLMYNLTGGFYLGADVAKHSESDFELSLKSRYSYENSAFLLDVYFENDHHDGPSLNLGYVGVF